MSRSATAQHLIGFFSSCYVGAGGKDICPLSSPGGTQHSKREKRLFLIFIGDRDNRVTSTCTQSIFSCGVPAALVVLVHTVQCNFL